MSLVITSSMKNALAELYYGEALDQKGLAYISLENMHSQLKNDSIFSFKKGIHAIKIRLPEKIVHEIKEIVRPINKPKEKPNFLFDFFACRIGQKDRYDDAIVANPLEVCWVKIGKKRFSNAQAEALERTKLQLAFVYIHDILVSPKNIELEWEIKTANEWLDIIDEKRNEAESDDDFF